MRFRAVFCRIRKSTKCKKDISYVVQELLGELQEEGNGKSRAESMLLSVQHGWNIIETNGNRKQSKSKVGTLIAKIEDSNQTASRCILFVLSILGILRNP